MPVALTSAWIRPVQVEVPVEAVVVVPDRGDEADHQPELPPRLGHVEPQVAVLPEEPEVLLVHADRVADHLRVAHLVGQRGVEVVDLAQTVAAELEAVGESAEEVLAAVEVVLPVASR